MEGTARLVDAGLQHEHVVEAQVHVSAAQEVAANFQRLHLAASIESDVVLDHRLAAAWDTAQHSAPHIHNLLGQQLRSLHAVVTAQHSPAVPLKFRSHRVTRNRWHAFVPPI